MNSQQQQQKQQQQPQQQQPQQQQQKQTVSNWVPVKKISQSSSVVKDTPPTQQNIRPSSSVKEFQADHSKTSSFKNPNSSKIVAFQKQPHTPSNAQGQPSKRSGIFYDISAGRGNYDDGYYSDYKMSIKQSSSAGNLRSFGHSGKTQPNAQMVSSSSVNAFPQISDSNKPYYNNSGQGKRKQNNGKPRSNPGRNTSYSTQYNNNNGGGYKYKHPNNNNNNYSNNPNNINNSNSNNNNSNQAISDFQPKPNNS